MAAVVAGWLTGAVGALAVVPFAAYVFVFVAILILPGCVAFWDSDGLARRDGKPQSRFRMSAAERRRANADSLAIVIEIATTRYRPLWLIGPVALGFLVAMLSLFGGFASLVVALDGQPVHATVVRADSTRRLADSGSDVECVLARPDGTRIPGALPLEGGDVCGESEDVIVDPHGLVDPVRQGDDPGALAEGQAVLLGLALVSGIPAAWPKGANGPQTGPEPAPEQSGPAHGAAHRRRRSRLRRKRRQRK